MTTRPRNAPALLLLLLLAACGQSVPRLPALPADAVIVAFGDSLTFGTGADPDQSYPAVLEQLAGRRVVNAGVPGEVTAQGLQRLPKLLDQEHPNLLILCHGGNDLLRRLGSEQMRRNLGAMIERARQAGVSVVLIGVPRPALLRLHSADVYDQLADHYTLPFEDEALAQIESDATLKSDQIHPNAQGYRKLAEAVYALLRRAGAL